MHCPACLFIFVVRYHVHVSLQVLYLLHQLHVLVFQVTDVVVQIINFLVVLVRKRVL